MADHILEETKWILEEEEEQEKNGGGWRCERDERSFPAKYLFFFFTTNQPAIEMSRKYEKQQQLLTWEC